MEAEGRSKAIEKVADAKAYKYEKENLALQKYFIEQAVQHKKLETVENSLKNGTKYVIDPNTEITNVITEQMGGITPIKEKKK